MAAPPSVIYPLTLPSLLQHVLATQTSSTSTTLIICSTKDAFLQNLVNALQPHQNQEQTREKLLQLATPTLHNLFTARHVKVAFCASVQSLLAYFTAFTIPATSEELGPSATVSEAGTSCKARIVLVNPLGLHAATPSFSAQGLSRTFAAAVETSLRVQAQLLVAECTDRWVQPRNENDDDSEGGEDKTGEGPAGIEDPWDQDVSILNVSARKFGDRAWAGRTVKAKRVAGRWFRFHRLDNLAT